MFPLLPSPVVAVFEKDCVDRALHKKTPPDLLGARYPIQCGALRGAQRWLGSTAPREGLKQASVLRQAEPDHQGSLYTLSPYHDQAPDACQGCHTPAQSSPRGE